MSELHASYDRSADVLYVTTSENGPAIAREADDGIVWRYLRDTNEHLVGATVMHFRCYWSEHMTDLVKQIASRFHVEAAQADRVIRKFQH